MLDRDLEVASPIQASHDLATYDRASYDRATYDRAPYDRDYFARWGGIMAGTVTVLALLVLFGEIGMALGLSVYDAGDRAASYVIGVGVWGVVSAILAYFGGGFVGSAAARHMNPRAGAAQGFLVWAVAVPVLGILAISFAIQTVAAAGVTTIAAVQADPAAAAAARDAAQRAATEAKNDVTANAKRPEFDRTATASSIVATAAKRTGALGWAAVIALLLSMGAAIAGGSVGTRCASKCWIEQRSVARGPGTRPVGSDLS